MNFTTTQPVVAGMDRLVRTIQELSLAQDIESVMHIVRRVARELTGADGATFVLREDDKCYYADEDAISPLWKGCRFPMKTCISGWTMLNKQSVVIEDIYADERIPADAYRPTFVKSLAMVPIRTIDPIGAIGNYWAKHYHPTEEQVRLLQALADITAVTMENIRIRNMLEQTVEERTRELAESLQRQEQLGEMKSAFLSMASHEFRTPLGTILSSAALVEKYPETEQQDKRKKHIHRIKSSVRNLIFILNDFLSLDKLEQGKVQQNRDVFDLRGFMNEVVEDLQVLRKENQQVQFTFTGNESALCDKNILRNVMNNLLSNALKYSDKDVRLDVHVNDEGIRIVVADQGIGIPAAQREKIFSKFFRASNSGSFQGTGLGLNIVHHYVALMDGTIGFTSEEGKGTTFTVQLPAS